jgi:hypothetical protein
MPENPDVGLARSGRLREKDVKFDAQSESRAAALPPWQSTRKCRVLIKPTPGGRRHRDKTLDRPEEMRKSPCMIRIDCDCKGRGTIGLATTRSR